MFYNVHKYFVSHKKHSELFSQLRKYVFNFRKKTAVLGIFVTE